MKLKVKLIRFRVWPSFSIQKTSFLTWYFIWIKILSMRFISIEFQEECINHLRAIFANSLQNCFQSKTNFALMHTSASVVGLYYTTYCPSNPCIYISTVEMPSFAGSKAYTKAYFKSNITKMEPRLCVHCRK